MAECGSLSKSSSDGYDLLSQRKKVLSKIKSRKRGMTPTIPQPPNPLTMEPSTVVEQYNPTTINTPNASATFSNGRIFYAGSSSDENRSSGHATMSDANRSSYISSSPTEEDNLRVILEDERQLATSAATSGVSRRHQESVGCLTGVGKSGRRALAGRRRAGDHHLRRVNADDNLLATIIAEEGNCISDVAQVIQSILSY